MFEPVRIRLTLWYAAVIAVVLAVFSLFVYVLLANAIEKRIDAGLQNVIDVAALSLQHEIEEHEGKEAGEESFRQVLRTMHQRTFPRQGIGVYEARRVVALKPGEGGMVPEWHDPKEAPFHTNDNRRDAIGTVYVPLARTTYEIVAAERLGAANTELAGVRQTLFTAVAVTFVLIALVAWFLAGRSLKPVEAMAQQQRQFMADASHELRTPISVARTAAEVTLESRTSTDSDFRESLAVIRSQMSRLTRIVQDMFTLAQADAGVYTLQRSPFYLDELLRDCAKAASILGSRRGVTVQMKPAPESLCHGDEGLVRQLAMILLDNAVKYTPEGGRVEVELAGAERGYRITVADTGIGIPDEARPYVFRRFYRVDKARSRASSEHGGSGAGLGLAIGRWIAEAHQGTLELTRSGPGGSVFTAWLPF
jgi:signal transduction histidine kinase